VCRAGLPERLGLRAGGGTLEQSCREAGGAQGGIGARYAWQCRGRSAEWEARPEYVYR